MNSAERQPECQPSRSTGGNGERRELRYKTVMEKQSPREPRQRYLFPTCREQTFHPGGSMSKLRAEEEVARWRTGGTEQIGG